MQPTAAEMFKWAFKNNVHFQHVDDKHFCLVSGEFYTQPMGIEGNQENPWNEFIYPALLALKQCVDNPEKT